MSSSSRKVEVQDGRINFQCLMEKCPSSCCGPFGGVSKGILSVDGTDMAEITLTDEDQRRLVQSGNSFRMELTDSGHYRMKLIADGPLKGQCQSFTNGQCAIHKVKPTLCRAFPFYVDMFVGLCGITECPGFGAHWTALSDLKPEVTATREMYQFWLNQVENRKD